jgi:hypothetical protein
MPNTPEIVDATSRLRTFVADNGDSAIKADLAVVLADLANQTAKVDGALEVFRNKLHYGDPEGPFYMRDALKKDYL